MTEFPVFTAILHALQPLCEYGFRFVRHGDDVLATVAARDGIHTRSITTRDLIEGMAGGDDPCAMFAEAFGL